MLVNCLFCGSGLGEREPKASPIRGYEVCDDCSRTIEDYYQILGLAYTVDLREIGKAFRKTAHKYHPDKWSHANDAEKKMAEDAFKKAGAAYHILTDPEKKKGYDQAFHLRWGSSSKGSTGRASTGRTAPPSPPTPPPPPRIYNPVIAVGKVTMPTRVKENDPVEVSFIVSLVSGDLPPGWDLAFELDGEFLNAVNVRRNPPDQLPMQVSVIIPAAQPGEWEGSIGVKVTP